ncbi:glutamate binding protein [Marasmius fiardii PR-910]|nr:glutamate binding protein [Marasmius fiardii PR-910]
MSQYPVPPPSYQATPSSPRKNGYQSVRDDSRDPLLGNSSRTGGGAFYDQPEAGDLPDDFKYGVTVSESSAEIRHAFIRKVYTILLIQIAATCIVGGFVSRSPNVITWVLSNTWAFYVPLIGTLINLGLLQWQRHNHPLNFVLLSTFTLLEAFTLGVAVAFYDNLIVLEALMITTGVFLGLTIFTFQSKYDFDGLGPWLFAGLITLLMGGLISIFFPMNSTMDLIFAIGGCLIFSGYIIYDTHRINNRLSPDEFIMGSISLYLDFVNLFLYILRILNNVQNRD